MDDLGRLLDDATTGLDPDPSLRGRIMRRAKVRRILNATAGAGLTIALVAGLFLGGDLLLSSAEGRGADVVDEGRSRRLQWTTRDFRIAQAEAAGVPWILTANRDASCLTVTLGTEDEAVGSGTCEGRFAALNFSKVRYDGQLFVVGSVGRSVVKVELQATLEDGQSETTHVEPVDLYPAPEEVVSDHRFFVAAVPWDARSATVVAKQTGSPTVRTEVRLAHSASSCAFSLGEAVVPPPSPDLEGEKFASAPPGPLSKHITAPRPETSESLFDGLRRALQDALSEAKARSMGVETCTVSVTARPPKKTPN